MRLEEFIDSLKGSSPPIDDPLLSALWYSGKGNWQHAHQIAQDMHDLHGSWIHAHLHREEGDEWNANYWYKRAGREMPSLSIREEWEQLVGYFLENQ